MCENEIKTLKQELNQLNNLLRVECPPGACMGCGKWGLLFSIVLFGNNEICYRCTDDGFICRECLRNKELIGRCLLIACFKGYIELCKILVKSNDVDRNLVNLGNYVGKTPLILACQRGHIEIIKILLSHPAINVNCKDEDGQSALFWCTEVRFRAECFKLLLAHPDIDINIQDTRGWTPLMNANINNIKLLLESPEININICTKDSESVLQIFFEFGDLECMELLLARGCNVSKWENWNRDESSRLTRIGHTQAESMMLRWRSYLPEWSIFTLQLYPLEFHKLAFKCICAWNRLNKIYNIFICKDIRYLLITYIAKNWRKRIF